MNMDGDKLDDIKAPPTPEYTLNDLYAAIAMCVLPGAGPTQITIKVLREKDDMWYIKAGTKHCQVSADCYGLKNAIERAIKLTRGMTF